MAGVLVQQDLQPHRGAQPTLGDQLGRPRRRACLAAGAAAGGLIAAAAEHTAVGLDLDLDLLGVFGVAALPPGLATARTNPLGFGKLDKFLADG
jgi:hypothetical protein